MTDYGEATCTECGEWSELLLAPRFPHICSRCLFPPARAENTNRTVEMPAQMRANSRSILRDLTDRLTHGPSMMRQL